MSERSKESIKKFKEQILALRKQVQETEWPEDPVYDVMAQQTLDAIAQQDWKKVYDIRFNKITNSMTEADVQRSLRLGLLIEKHASPEGRKALSDIAQQDFNDALEQLKKQRPRSNTPQKWKPKKFTP